MRAPTLARTGRAGRWPELAVVAAVLLLAAGRAQAHKPSDSYLSLEVRPEEGASASGAAGLLLTGRWDIALKDLDVVLGLDADGDGQLTWGEVKAHEDAISAYALSRLTVLADGRACPFAPLGPARVIRHSDGAYLVLGLQARCPLRPERLTLGYQLFFDQDLTHRGLLRLVYRGQTRTAIFSPSEPRFSLDLARLAPWRQLINFVTEGVGHIWKGIDHILFLLALLLPAVLERRGQHWQGVSTFRPALFDVLRIVTSFTIAHSITLILAALGLVVLPSRLVESAIAASVVIVAVNNLWPLFPDRRWLAGFALGLLHGFGFAGALTDLGLFGAALGLALVGFNLGVEIGQVAIVAVFLPLAFGLRRSWAYRRLVLTFGSVLIAVLAAVWLAERSLEVRILGIGT